MMRPAHHLANEFRLSFYLKRRYWFQTLLGLLFMTGLFGALLYAVASVGGKAFSSGALGCCWRKNPRSCM